MSRFSQLRDEIGEFVAGAAPSALTYAKTPSAVQVPAVVVIPGTPFAQYWTGNGRSTVYQLRVVFLLAQVAEEAAQEVLDDWASDDGPIISALSNADFEDAEVLSVTGSEYGRVVVGSAQYVGFSLVVIIEA